MHGTYATCYMLAHKYALANLKTHVAETVFIVMELRGLVGRDIDGVAYAYGYFKRTSGMRRLLRI